MPDLVVSESFMWYAIGIGAIAWIALGIAEKLLNRRNKSE